ncbi:MAG: phosphatidate cytidylyltransferase [Lachnospiraceae bacterium]|nr:phosphatidate cytidylyltransferase [Lachnospiraceae bacterium]MBP3570248.1 phosphatidate cytidylyltransferase [Lachnospiraceae bacterium]
MFKTRLLSSIVLMILMLAFVITGGNVLLAAIAFLALVAMMEFLRMEKLHKTSLAIPAYIAVVLLYILFFLQKTELLLPLCVCLILVVMALYVFAFPKYKVEQIVAAYFGFFYAGLLISYVYQVRMLPGGAFSVWLIFIAAWGSDVCAYCAGMLFGKHKAFPVLSPKKTWEGCVGGVIGAAIIAVLYCLAMNHWFDQSFSLLQYAFVCACGAVISQIGDLAASAMKRNNEIKDYGKLIPGHGGVLDRYDSVIFVAPIVFYLLQMTM